MKRNRAIIGLVVGVLISSQGAAHADFSGDFAPDKWTYSETGPGPAGSLNATTMILTGAENGSGYNISGLYSITIPNGVSTISFTFSYVSQDIGGSFHDPSFIILNGSQTQLSSPNLLTGEMETQEITLDVAELGGTTFSFEQKSKDTIFGEATTTITKFDVKRFSISVSNLNVLSSEENPTISSDATGYTCKPGKFSLLSKGINRVTGSPTSIAYTLIVGGVRVSSVSSDNWSVMSRSSVAVSNNSVTGTASLTSATWALKGAADSSARCEVVALQDGVTSLSGSR